MSQSSKYQKCTASELKLDPITDLGKRWALVTAAKPDGSINTMTVSWGGTGVLFGRPVAFLFIRPQRYTREFTEASDFATLSFFSEKYREALTICGRMSGKNADKIGASGLTPCVFGQSVSFEQADTVLVLKKLYRSGLFPEGFVNEELRKEYFSQNDYHTVYVYEIIEGYKKSE